MFDDSPLRALLFRRFCNIRSYITNNKVSSIYCIRYRTMETTTSSTIKGSIPENANSECVGPTSQSAGTVSSCDGCPNQKVCASGAYNTPEAIQQQQQQQQLLYQSLCNVSHIILILSGKGGVGKSTLATQLAITLSSSLHNYSVGLLDVDLCGPSVPSMIFGKSTKPTNGSTTHTQPATAGSMVVQQQVHQNSNGVWIPIQHPYHTNLYIMSIQFLLQSQNQNDAIIWRGPRKNSIIQQFITNVDWNCSTSSSAGDSSTTTTTGGGLDYLIIDTPPGTSDEHISTVQYIQQAITAATAAAASGSNNNGTIPIPTLGAIVITTPEEASLADVRKELSFCTKTKLHVYGIVENMATIEISLMEQNTNYTNIDTTVDTNKEDTTSLSSSSSSILQFIHRETGQNCTTDVLQLLRNKCPEFFQYNISCDLFTTTTTLPMNGITNEQQPQQQFNRKSVVQEMAQTYNIPYWGTIPLDRQLLLSCENGAIQSSNKSSTNDESTCFVQDYPQHNAAIAIQSFCTKIIDLCPVEMDDDDEENDCMNE